MNEEIEYQKRELHWFKSSRKSFFETATEFDEYLTSKGSEWIMQQIDWVANGSYGVGACLALQMAYTYNPPSKTYNREACCGRVILRAFYGTDIRWQQLSKETQALFSECVNSWLIGKVEFGIEAKIQYESTNSIRFEIHNQNGEVLSRHTTRETAEARMNKNLAWRCGICGSTNRGWGKCSHGDQNRVCDAAHYNDKIVQIA